MNLRRAALVGLLAGALDVAVGELFAAALQWSGTKGTPSPVLAIGSAFVDLTPPWLKDFATSTFGTDDKTVLLTGMGLVLALLAMGIGVLAARNRTAGLAAVVVLGAVAALAAATRPDATAIDVLPAVVGAVAGMGVLAALLDRAADPDTPAYRGHDRRAFLRAGLITGGVSVLAGGGAIWIGKGERSVQASAAAVRLPVAGRPRAGRPGRRGPPAEGPHAVRHVARGVLPDRHGARGPAADHRGVAAAAARHGAERGEPHVRPAARPAAHRALRHLELRVERGRRRPDRQRPLAGLPA